MGMDTEITIKVSSALMEQVERYASERNTTVSELVEHHLRTLVQDRQEKDRLTPLVKSLSGFISLPENFDFKKSCGEYLDHKYS